MSSTNSPIPTTRLAQIATDACVAAFDGAEVYDHSKTEAWNTTIINSILKSLISESTPTTSSQPAYKYAINSTIIQHLTPTPPRSSSSSSATTKENESEGAVKEHAGRRGMHSATGAYWNESRDGMWSFKFGEGMERGMDVVICVIWIGV